MYCVGHYFPTSLPWRSPKNTTSYLEEPCVKTFTGQKTKRLLVARGLLQYCKLLNGSSCGISRDLGIFRGISEYLFIYSAIVRGTLFRKHWYRVLWASKTVLLQLVSFIIIILVMIFMWATYSCIPEFVFLGYTYILLWLFCVHYLCYMYCHFAREICVFNLT